jgi:hypothetical protein
MNDAVLKEYGLMGVAEVGEKIDTKLSEWNLKYEEMNRRASAKEVCDIS